MKAGSILKDNVIYYTKDGAGNIIKFNIGHAWGVTTTEAIITPEPTHTNDVWYAGGISRHIKDISETKEEAKHIKYPN